jgi:hypothetical protein
MIPANSQEVTGERGAFGQGMRDRRLYLGLSIELASTLSGISRARWSQLELGYEVIGRDQNGVVHRKQAKPSPPTVRKIAHVLQWPTIEAFAAAGIDPDDEPPPAIEADDRDRKAVILELVNDMPPVVQDGLVKFIRAMKYPHGVEVPDMRAAS